MKTEIQVDFWGYITRPDLKDIAVMQQEGIKTGFAHFLQALLSGQQSQLLNDLDLMHFHRNRGTIVKFDLRHFSSSSHCFFNGCII